MRDSLEAQLAARLGELGDTVEGELPPPVDLELLVLRRRRRERSTRRWASLGIAATIAIVAASVAVVRGNDGRGSLRVSSSSTTFVPVRDALQPGTTMLSARGHYVISLDATGHTNATMVKVKGNIIYTRATDDHRELWYLSVKAGSTGCGDVVRADIEGRSSKIVARAVAFDVSPDGSRLALYGAGDLAHDRCAPVTAGSEGRIVVLDLTNAYSSAAAVGNVSSMQWSANGSSLAVVSCTPLGCKPLQRIDVPTELGAPLRVASSSEARSATIRSANVVFGPRGLYTLETVAAGPGSTATTDTIRCYDAGTFAAPVPVFSGGTQWRVSQVVPTAAGIYVVAMPQHLSSGEVASSGEAGLYRIDSGRLTFVRSLSDPGTLTPVEPLAGAG